MGAGDDTFQWDPGDGSDIVEGQDGADTMLFNGSNGDEIFEASANGERVRFTRNLGNIVMDLNDVEAIDLNALGGTDTTTVNDLSAAPTSSRSISTWPAPSAGRPAMARPTSSSSTAPTATISSTSSARGLRSPCSGYRPR